MDSPQNHIRIEILSHRIEKGINERLGIYQIILTPGVNIVSPDIFVQMSNGKFERKDIYGFNANIYCNDRSTLIIHDFQYFTLAAYSNSDPILGGVKSYNISRFFRLNNLKIRRLDSENSNSLVANCAIDEFYVGIESYHKENKENGKSIEDNPITTDVRSSTVSKIKTFSRHKYLNIQDSKIDELNANNDIEYFHCWEGSNIQRLLFSKSVEKARFDDSSIELFLGQKKTSITEIISSNTSFVRIFELDENKVLSRNDKSLEILLKSYKNSQNKEKQFEYSFLYQKNISGNITNRRHKLFLKLLELTCGYGYKPERGFYTLFIIWFSFSLIFTIISFFPDVGLSTNGNKINGIIGIPYSMYFSAITFTTIGYGDVVPTDWLTRILAGIEGILGISTMAIIIFALTKHE